MKPIIKVALAALLITSAIGAFAQAPADLSFLTNRASFASWALKQVDNISPAVLQTAAGSPNGGVWVGRDFNYSGPASLSAMARFISGTTFQLPTPIPDSLTIVRIKLGNSLPDGEYQNLFEGYASGRAEYDGNNWRLPPEASEPNMLLAWSIFIPAPCITAAWVVETNAWGQPYKRSLEVRKGQGFFFENTLAGEAYLCLEFIEQKGNGGPSQWVYNLHTDGLRAPMSLVLVLISLRDSEDIRDYGDNPAKIGHWLYTYRPDNSSLTYGKVPLLVASFTTNTTTMIVVGSAAGYANKFIVTRMADELLPAEWQFEIDVPAGQDYTVHNFGFPGLYHLVPLGIDVCADWWKIQDVNGNYGKGGGTVPVPVPVEPPTSGGGGGGGGSN